MDLIFKRILDKFSFNVETEIEDDIKPGYIYVKPAIVISESLNQDRDEFTKHSRLYTAMQLFKNHKLSSGQAAELARIDKFQFWAELNKNGILLIDYDPSELESELERFNQ